MPQANAQKSVKIVAGWNQSPTMNLAVTARISIPTVAKMLVIMGLVVRKVAKNAKVWSRMPWWRGKYSEMDGVRSHQMVNEFVGTRVG